VGPPWEQGPPGVEAIVIDPGRAFGTGAHATTRLAIELLQGLRPSSLLDVGCGSGVLSIAAAKLGFGPVFAIDNEQDAVDVAQANARVNSVEVQVWRADGLVDEIPPAQVVLANIALNAVEDLLPRVKGPFAITSGYLDQEELRAPGWRRIERRDREGWAADLLERA
jgi:ribosomal protein L11 methyltransferase